MESQESFSTKVKKMTSDTPSREEMIQAKLERDRGKQTIVCEEPRRCPRLDMTDLAMKRAAQKNEIPGNKLVVPTVLNSNSDMLVDMTDKLGICADKKDMHVKIVSVIQTLEHTRKTMFEES
jgi:hypothetical protein